jgi:site-specific recombinase XerD
MTDVNWNEPSLVKWLGTTARKGTTSTYQSYFRIYSQYTGMTAEQLIDEALEDAKGDIRQRKDVVKTRLLQFYQWLKTEYLRKSRGKGHHRILGKGLSDSAATCAVMAIRSFYSTYDINVKLKGRQRLPKPKIENRRIMLTPPDVKLLVDHARSLRDRAIILVMFQGGMDTSTLCNIKYAAVARGLLTKEHPLKLELQREKTGVSYYTFLGRDAIEAVNAYISDLKLKGVVFDNGLPLFLKQNTKAKSYEKLDTNLVQNMLKKVALSSGFIDEHMNGAAFNLLGPYALRESFGSIMINKGVPDSIVDFWIGHEIGEMAEAYKRGRFAEIRQMYLDRELDISISAPSSDIKKFEENNKTLSNLVTQQSLKITTLENQLSNVQEAIAEIKEFQKEMKHFEKGGATVIYHSSSGFLPDDLSQIADDALGKQKQALESEIQKIDNVLKQHKEPQTEVYENE